ncbi:MAG: hypothetical protein QM764_09855 [Chitinophagaceae bacterium]
MNESILAIVISSFAFLVAIITFFLVKSKRDIPPPPNDNFSSKPLQLQAYERIAMLAERIAIPNLISRVGQQVQLSTREMQLLLLENIKQEYEYNASQQIYVTQPVWDAVKNLKDQNMLIINQMAATLPEDARGIDLNRRLLEFCMNQPIGQLHSVVLEALNYEAKKLML